MNNFVKRIEAECAMIAQVDEEAAKLWRAYILLGGKGVYLKHWEALGTRFITAGLLWKRTREGREYWSNINNKLIALYGTEYSYKDYDQHKTENRQ